MKVILLKDVKKQGKKDDILEVSDGYAKNFLIKNGLAVQYTSGSKNVLDKEIEKRNKDEENLINECNKLKEQTEKDKISFVTKSGKDGKIFGTISTKQIAEELSKKGYKIDSINIDYFLSKTGTDINNINNELEKLFIYKEDNDSLIW